LNTHTLNWLPGLAPDKEDTAIYPGASKLKATLLSIIERFSEREHLAIFGTNVDSRTPAPLVAPPFALTSIEQTVIHLLDSI
jgi:hypothetical protein